MPKNAQAALTPQTFTRMNRGDMYVPANAQALDSPRFLLAAAAATPFLGRIMPVHSVPVTYIAPGRINMVSQAAFKTPVFGVRS